MSCKIVVVVGVYPLCVQRKLLHDGGLQKERRSAWSCAQWVKKRCKGTVAMATSRVRVVDKLAGGLQTPGALHCSFWAATFDRVCTNYGYKMYIRYRLK